MNLFEKSALNITDSSLFTVYLITRTIEGKTACHCYNDSFRPQLLDDNRLSLINVPPCLKENKCGMSWTSLDCHPADDFITRVYSDTMVVVECLYSQSFC